MQLKKLLFAATVCGAALVPCAAMAQEAMMGEVIVTARKRQESILNVPVIETALPQEALERFQTQDLADLATRVPGLQLGEAVLSIGSQVSLRGVGTATLDAGVDQSISLNLDGLQQSQGLAYSSAMFDVGQVEVLKGPQALFYGKNSPGGVIAIRTADPTDKFEVMVRGGYEFEARERRGEVVISGPVSETLRLRLASMYAQSDGFYRNRAFPLAGTGAAAPTHKRTPNSENFVLRGTALWDPTSNFNARLKLNYVQDSTEESAYQFVSCPEGFAAPFGIPFLGGGEDCSRNRNISMVNFAPAAAPGIKNGGVPFIDTSQKFGTFDLNYTPIEGLTINSTTGYYIAKSSSMINGMFATYAGGTLAAENDFRREEFTQEVRINSDFVDSPVNFTLGGFYQDGEMNNFVTLRGNTAYRLPAILRAGSHNLDIKSISAFGQLRWQVIPTLEIAAGARWTDEERTNRPITLIGGVLTPVTLAVPKIQSDNISPELTVTYRPLDNLTLFGSLKRGFKSGSFTVTVPVNAGQDVSFGDERVDGGEIGAKTRLLDRRLSMNIAYYNYRYKGLQVGASQPSVGGLPVITTVNAGAAQVYGIEFDASYTVPQVEGLSVFGAVNWNHARYKRLENVPCYGGQTIAEGCTEVQNPMTGLFTAQNLNGERLLRAPDWQANFGFDYERPLDNGMTLLFSNTNLYSSKYPTVLGFHPARNQQSWIKSDITLALKGQDERWEVALIGKNITNRLTQTNCGNNNAAGGSILGGLITGGAARGPAGIDELMCFMERGREAWIRVTYRPAN